MMDDSSAISLLGIKNSFHQNENIELKITSAQN